MEKDLREKGYLCDPERFADLINGVVCEGKKILQPSDLTEADSQTGFLRASGRGQRRTAQRRQQYRDVVKKAAFGINFMVIGIENQEEVHYLMPLRCMSYDAAEYERQAALARNRVRRQKGISSAEFLSGFTKESRLHPCVTLVLYYGQEWDGAENLHGLLDFTDIPEELREKVNDYRIHVCEVRKFEQTSLFQTDLKRVFDCTRYADDKEKLYKIIATDPAYRELDEETYDVIAEHIKTTELLKIKEYNRDGGKIDMCGAIAELIQEGRIEGLNQGIEQGIEQGVRALIETCIEYQSTKEATQNRLVEKMQISPKAAEGYINKYWH